VASDLKNWDLFKDPLWLRSNLLKKYKVIHIDPSNWSTSNSGSGVVEEAPVYLRVRTGTTANSRGLAWHPVHWLNSGDAWYSYCDYSKRLEWEFLLVRVNSDAESVGRIQLKQVNSEGALAALGLGLQIDNFTVTGEAYGTARGTVSLGTMTPGWFWNVRIVHVPGVRVEFWVNDDLAGVLTGTAVPSGLSSTSFIVVSIINGPTGGVNAFLDVSKMRIVQEW